MPMVFRTGRHTKFKLGTQTYLEYEDPHQRQTPWPKKVKGQGRKVTWRVWHVLADKSRTKRPRNTKIGANVLHRTGNNEHQFQGQRSKVKVTRPTNAETLSLEVRNIFRTKRPHTNFKLDTQTEHEDQHQQQGCVILIYWKYCIACVHSK